MPYLIPAVYISILALAAPILCGLAFMKSGNMVRSSLVSMLRAGLILLGLATMTFGGLYLYFNSDQVEIEMRQVLVRILLAYMFSAFDLWLIILLKWGKTL